MAKKNRHQSETLLPRVENEKIKFSFEFYDLSREDYCISHWQQAQIKEAIKRLRDINCKTFNKLRAQHRVLHFGEVYWEKTIEKNGFPDPRVKNMNAFHFALLGVNSQLARVYGAYSKGTFYIVWFDLNHSIWPTPLRNT